jgi:hypothetical protein
VGIGSREPSGFHASRRYARADPFTCHSERSEESARAARSALLTRIALIIASLAILMIPCPVAAQAQAQDGTATAENPNLNHAGLVIRHGDGRLTYAFVAFAEDEVSGIELLRRTGIEQVTIPFGGLGEGVCAIEGEGCPASECRRRVCQASGADAPYWRYFGLGEHGEWQPFALGASSTEVRDGDVHGWSWTAEDPGLPAVTLADVARLAGAPPDGAPATGDGRAAFVLTYYPPGFEPGDDDGDDQDPLTYAAAAAILILIGGGTLYAIRRGRTRGDGHDAEEAVA